MKNTRLARRCMAFMPLAIVLAGIFSTAAAVGEEPALEKPSVLMLPAVLSAGANNAIRAEAEAACDRLAQGIAAAGLARVVDRRQLDRVLQERDLAAKPAGPMLSYDAMIRLEVDNARLAPEARLSLIDLSTGNVLREHTFRWPLAEADIAPIVAICREAFKGVGKPTAGKLRVRALWAAEAVVNERLRPLARRLIDVFEQSFKRSDRVVLVHHFEAATSKEESLLLLMGLSQLPGGRQFTPQADATIELRVVEGDGRGKTFPETPVEIGVRLRKGADYAGDWATTAGLVRDFDSLIPQAWQKLAGSLGEVRPDAAGALLDEMALRRKQAEAELQAMRNLSIASPSNQNDDRKYLKTALTILAHAEAAVKLDPTYSTAVCAQIRALDEVCYWDWREPRQMPDANLRTLREAIRCIERFRDNGELCGSACSNVLFSMLRSPLWRLREMDKFTDLLRHFDETTIALAPEWLRSIDDVKRLLERGLEDDVSVRFFRFDVAATMAIITYRGMILSSVPAAEREAWLEGILRRCDERAARCFAGKHDNRIGVYDWIEYANLRIRAAELSMMDGRPELAARILRRILSDAPSSFCGQFVGSSSQLMRRVIAGTGDARLSADFEQWCRQMGRQKVSLIEVRWPALNVFPPQRSPEAAKEQYEWLRKHCVEVDMPRRSESPYSPRHQALAEGDGRLYLAAKQVTYQFGYVPLDGRGHPIGKPLLAKHGMKVWSDIHTIPRPSIDKTSEITSACYADGKLFVGTRGSGMHEFDPKTETWKPYGPEQGLPSAAVLDMIPIGRQMLYCSSEHTHFTLNTVDGAVTLVCPALHGRSYLSLCLLWFDGDRLMAIESQGIWSDVLGKDPRLARLSHRTCYGWDSCEMHLGIVGAAEAAGRRFYSCRGGLYEINPAGNVIRSWWTGYSIHPAGSGLSTNTGMPVSAPADCPIVGLPKIQVAGSRLVLADGDHVVIYDLKTDTWYDGVCAGFITPRGGLWMRNIASEGLCYLSLDDVIQRAKDTGRSITTAEFRRRKQQFIDAAAPLDRAKFNLGMRRFDKAKTAFQEVLDAEPNQPEALILMGFLHDACCLNQPDEAIRYYRRAAELKDNPAASYSGMYYQLCILRNRSEWRDVLDLCETILRRYLDWTTSDEGKSYRFVTTAGGNWAKTTRNNRRQKRLTERKGLEIGKRRPHPQPLSQGGREQVFNR